VADTLNSLSNALAAAVEGVGNSVVRVEARRHLPASGIVWSADGVIVTAHHVVERDENISLGLPDGQSVPALLVGRDHTTDVAVLRAERAEQAQASGLVPPKWAEPDSLRVGQLVLGLARPGRNVQAVLGILTALGDSWRTPAGGSVDRYVQPDLVMYPGFSGGLLADVSGRVVGMNTSGLMRGASLTLPATTLRQVVDALLAHGRVRRGYLGVGGQAVRLPEGLAQQLGQASGLLLVSVEASGPAEQGGLLIGDIIVGLNSQPVRHTDDLLALLGGDRIGVAVSVRVVRGGQLQDIKVVVGERA
jgi:S1-C subfamily serine protease